LLGIGDLLRERALLGLQDPHVIGEAVGEAPGSLALFCGAAVLSPPSLGRGGVGRVLGGVQLRAATLELVADTLPALAVDRGAVPCLGVELGEAVSQRPPAGATFVGILCSVLPVYARLRRLLGRGCGLVGDVAETVQREVLVVADAHPRREPRKRRRLLAPAGRWRDLFAVELGGALVIDDEQLGGFAGA
jgi:hypothetical protein